MNKDYYKILELGKGATPSEIKSSFRKLSMRHHPDKNGGSEESERKFKEINEDTKNLTIEEIAKIIKQKKN